MGAGVRASQSQAKECMRLRSEKGQGNRPQKEHASASTSLFAPGAPLGTAALSGDRRVWFEPQSLRQPSTTAGNSSSLKNQAWA